MIDSHDDNLWEVPSIDMDVPAEAAASVEAAAHAPEPVEPVAPAEDAAIATSPYFAASTLAFLEN